MGETPQKRRTGHSKGADVGEISAQAGAGDEVPAQAEAETVFDEIWPVLPSGSPSSGSSNTAIDVEPPAGTTRRRTAAGPSARNWQADVIQKGQQGKPPRKPHKDERHGKGRDRERGQSSAPKREQLNPEHSPSRP